MDSSSISKVDSSNVNQLLDSFDNWIFDCDGVLWRSSGLLDGVAESLQLLRDKGKKIFFVTNNSTNSRDMYKKKLDKFGIAASKEEIYCSAYGAAAYLESIHFKKKVYVIGEAGIIHELNEVGIPCIDSNEVHTSGVPDWAELEKLEVDPEVGAVVVGFDRRTNYLKNCYAFLCLQQLKDCLFIATNLDSTFPSGNGKIFPGGGTIVAPLEVATGRKPLVIGKPEPWLLDAIVNKHQLDKSRTVMVGDRLDTDILFGLRGNLKTLLVLTGVTSSEELYSTTNTIHPNYLMNSIGDLAALVKKANTN